MSLSTDLCVMILTALGFYQEKSTKDFHQTISNQLQYKEQDAMQSQIFIQLWKMNMDHLSSKPYVNGITLREQKPPLKCRQPLDFWCAFLKSLDVLMLKIWGLQVNGLQSYWPSNFQNDWTATGNRTRADWLTGAGAGRQTFS